MQRATITALLGMMSLVFCTWLAGCASEPFPNIDDPVVAEFYHQVRLAVTQGMGDTSGLKAASTKPVTIGFIYDDGGAPASIHIMDSSHDGAFDAKSLEAVEHARLPPKPASLEEVHHYVVQLAITNTGLEVSTVTLGKGNKVSFVTGSGPLPAPAAPVLVPPKDANPAVAAFEALLQKAVDKKARYPKESIMSGDQGMVEVEFDYLGDGKATNITLGAITASGALNRAAMKSVSEADLPPKPPELASMTHFHVMLTYTLGG